jgi:translation initiation factor IF-3
MNYSKFKYQEDKRKREVKRHAVETRVEVKELKMRYNIGEADYGVRLRAVGPATFAPYITCRIRFWG